MEVVNNRGAVVAQLVEQLIRNEQVAGSTPVNGSIFCVMCDTGFSLLISLLGLWLLVLRDVNFSVNFRNVTRGVVVLTELA